MIPEQDYLTINRKAWNAKTDVHVGSDFYDMEGFLAGRSSLHDIELGLLGEIKGQSILHLQCHFGQDSISMGRLGAQVTGVDLSDHAIAQAQRLADTTQSSATFIRSDVYDLPNHLEQTFDVVFTSYGVIGWLPNLDRWAAVIARFLKPNGRLVFVEFHPMVWMFNNQFTAIEHSYFKEEAFVETITGTYADRSADLTHQYVWWKHSMSDIINSLLNNGLALQVLQEFDYSPYDCFENTIEVAPQKFRIQHLGNKLPMIVALVATKQADGGGW